MRVSRPNPDRDTRRTTLTTDPVAAGPEETRRAAFRALVAAQGAGNTVKSSREHVARRFGLRDEHVRAIEREGIENNRPPLGGDAG
jgi:hypothetical protein